MSHAQYVCVHSSFKLHIQHASNGVVAAATLKGTTDHISTYMEDRADQAIALQSTRALNISHRHISSPNRKTSNHSLLLKPSSSSSTALSKIA
jgi:hypothetical protein